MISPTLQWFIFYQKKNEVLEYVMQYEAYVTSKHNCKISHIKCDNGGEYTSKDFKEFCVTKGIQIQYTTVYTP